MRVEPAAPHPQEHPGRPGCGTCHLSPAIPGFLFLWGSVAFPKMTLQGASRSVDPGTDTPVSPDSHGELSPRCQAQGLGPTHVQETPVWGRIHPAPLPPPGSSLPLTVAPVWDLGAACLRMKRLRNPGCACSPSPGASTQPCPCPELSSGTSSAGGGSQHSSQHSSSHTNPHAPGERGCFWPGSRKANTGGFPGNLLQFLPARQAQPRGPSSQLNSEPPDLPAPGRVGCCCGASLWWRFVASSGRAGKGDRAVPAAAHRDRTDPSPSGSLLVARRQRGLAWLSPLLGSQQRAGS